jgi:hypothetical protein
VDEVVKVFSDSGRVLFVGMNILKLANVNGGFALLAEHTDFRFFDSQTSRQKQREGKN